MLEHAFADLRDLIVIKLHGFLDVLFASHHFTHYGKLLDKYPTPDRIDASLQANRPISVPGGGVFLFSQPPGVAMTYKDVILQVYAEATESTVKEIEADFLQDIAKLDPNGDMNKELSDKEATKLFANFRSQLPAVKMWFGQGDMEIPAGDKLTQ